MKKIKFTLAVVVMLTMVCMVFVSCRKEDKALKAGDNPQPTSISPETAPGGAVITLAGQDIADIVKIRFSNGNVPAVFNSVFNTETALVFRVPDTANGGPQDIVFTNRLGKEFSVAFNVIALPSVNEVSNYNFTGGTIITLKGNNLADVSSVVLKGTTDAATIISQTKMEMTISMPTTTVNRANLDITNLTGTITTSQEFVNLDNAFKIFTDDYAPGYQDASWGDPGARTSAFAKSGTHSVAKKFAAGNWHQLGFGWTNISNDGYTYLSFWAKGASKDYSLWISTNTSVGGFASFEPPTRINVPANVWTYFKISVTTLNLWSTGPAFNQIGWRIQGPDGQDETFHLDDVILIK